MSKRVKPTLLEDLAGLLAKHGSEEFEQLARQLSNPEFTLQLADILSAFAHSSGGTRRVKTRRKPTIERHPQQEEHRGSASRDDAETRPMLSLIRERLADQAYYPTVQDVADFAHSLGAQAGKRRGRAELIASLSAQLTRRSDGELQTVLDSMRRRAPANELKGWSELIVSKK